MQTFKITKELIERHFDEFEHQMYFQIKNQLRPTFILTDLKDIDLERMTAKIRYRWVNDEAEVYHEQIKLTYEQIGRNNN